MSVSSVKMPYVNEMYENVIASPFVIVEIPQHSSTTCNKQYTQYYINVTELNTHIFITTEYMKYYLM